MERKPSLFEVAQNEGLELRHSGRAWKGHCPFHDDSTPSFFIYDDGRYKCFGCGEKGDAIDFIKKLKGISFNDALCYLGIDKSNQLSQTEIQVIRKKRNLVSAFRRWERDYYDELCIDYRAINSIMEHIRTAEEVEELHLLYHRLPILEYHLDILCEGSDEDRLELFKEVELWP